MVVARRTTRLAYQQAVLAAMRHARAHYLDDPLVLARLAEVACLSPYHFHRVFAGMSGETPGEFVRRLRLERAAHELRATARPVTEIAFDAGYATHEAFTKAFRAAFRATPSTFRRSPRLPLHLAAANGVHYHPLRSIDRFVPRDTGAKKMEVEILDHPGARLACVRHIGPYPEIGSAFARLGQFAGPLFAVPGHDTLAIYYDDPGVVPLTELRSDAAVLLLPGDAVPEGTTEGAIPPGRYARHTYIGPYEGLTDEWRRFVGEWAPSRGLTLSDRPSFEIYVGDCHGVPPEKLRTDLYVAIE